MPRLQKLSENLFQALSSWNRTKEGVGEDATERKGLWDKVDLHLGAIEQTNVRKRERERDKQKSTNKSSL